MGATLYIRHTAFIKDSLLMTMMVHAIFKYHIGSSLHALMAVKETALQPVITGHVPESRLDIRQTAFVS